VLNCGFYWPTIFKDVWRICSTCDQCQRAGEAISWRQQMPQQPMLFCEVFDVWGIDFIGPFSISFGITYILLAIYYVSKCIEAKAIKANDARVIINFVRSHIFTGLKFLDLSLLTKAPISAIGPWGLCFRSTRLCIRFLHHIIPKLTGKQRSQIGRLSGY